MYSFEQVVGHEYIIQSMKNSIRSNRISHAYIIAGSGGSGKKLLARSFTKGILCEMSTGEPCGSCLSCKSFENGNNPDVIYISKEKSIGVDDIREAVTATINIKPYKYDRKVYIIDKADTMTQAAQNALLKTIEDPARYAVLILISSNVDNLLPTVLSRCVHYKLKPVSTEDIEEYLLTRGYSQDDAETAAVYSGGSVGVALSFLSDTDMNLLREKSSILIDEIESRDLSSVLLLVSDFDDVKDRIGGVLDFMYLWYRDMLIYAETRDENAVSLKSSLPEMIRLMKSKKGALLKKSLFLKLDALLEAKQRLSKFANFQMVIEVMLLKMKTEEI